MSAPATAQAFVDPAELDAASLAHLRARTGLTAGSLARRLLISRSTLSRWELGTHRPAAAYLPALSRHLGVAQPVVERAIAHLPPARGDCAKLPGLAAIRRRQSVSAADVAAALGVRPSTVSAWENGTNPVPLHLLPALAAAINAPRAQLLAEVPARPAHRTPWATARRRFGMTQREAAAVLGISVTHLSRIENGHVQPARTVATAMVRTYRLLSATSTRG